MLVGRTRAKPNPVEVLLARSIEVYIKTLASSNSSEALNWTDSSALPDIRHVGYKRTAVVTMLVNVHVLLRLSLTVDGVSFMFLARCGSWCLQLDEAAS